MLDRITPLIITWNEIDNIGRTLAALTWARRIVVVDSGSTDGTLELLRADPRIDVLVRPFDDFARQCDAGLSRVGTEWTLSIDADYQVTAALIDELRAVEPAPEVGGYAVDFDYCVHGHSLRASLYPSRIVLHRTQGARYRMDGHGHRVDVPGRVDRLAGRIRHDDRKPIGRWLSAQARYAEQESRHLLAQPWRDLNWQDRVRRAVVIAPWLVPMYCLVLKRGLLDGLPGWHYALQRGIAEAALALRLIELKLAGATVPARKET
jgi:glycosyltransferase involved in cell wall biosynthesis